MPEVRSVQKQHGAASRLEDWGDFQIEYEYLETCVYWEVDRGCAFTSTWGRSPYTTYVPAADEWDAVVPAWIRGRRREVLERLARSSWHRLKVHRVLATSNPPGFWVAERWGPPGPDWAGRRPSDR